MSYPGNDPFYYYNAQENSVRINYYNITSTSHLIIDGIVDAGYSYAIWDSLFQMQMDVSSPMEINVSGTYNIDSREVDLNIRVIATDEITWGDLRLQCVTVENGIYWVAPNGLHVHNQVMRDMVPDGQGEAFSISNGDSALFVRDFFLDDTLNADSCEFMIFVQAYATKDVLQAGKIKLPDLGQTEIRDYSDRMPMASKIISCYPNPFNSSTMIWYSLFEASDVAISIFNILGQRIVTLNEGIQQGGDHNVVWDASAFPSGVYFARLEAGDTPKSVKIVLSK
jgi:hypothetical protein